MKRLLLLLSLFATAAFGAERQVINPDTNGNLVLRVYNGAVVDGLTITGTNGAAIIGPSGGVGSAANTVNGSLVGTLSTSYAAPTLTDLNAGYYRNAAGTAIAAGSNTGYVGLRLDRPTANNANALRVFSNYQDAQTAGSSVVSTNENAILIGRADGAWTIGFSGYTGTQTLNGNIIAIGASATGVTAELRSTGAGLDINATGTASAIRINRSSTANTSFQVMRAGTTTADFVVNTDGTVNVAGNSGQGTAFFVVKTSTSTTSCNTSCTNEPATLGSSSGTCLAAWNDAGTVLSASTVSGCADTSSIARRCLCIGMN